MDHRISGSRVGTCLTSRPSGTSDSRSSSLLTDPITLLMLIGGLLLAILLLMRRPELLPLVYMAMLPFPLAIGGEAGSGNVSVADCIAGFGLLVQLCCNTRWRFSRVDAAIIAFLSIAGLSACLSDGYSEALLGLGRMALVTLVPVMLFENLQLSTAQIRNCLVAYCAAAAALGLASIYYFITQGFQGSMYTLGINKNAMGPIFGTAVVVLFSGVTSGMFSRRQKRFVLPMLGLSGIGLLLCLSRGGWVGTAVGMMVVMLIGRRFKPLIIFTIVLAPLLTFMWTLLPTEAVDYATDISPDNYVIKSRLDASQVSMDEFARNPILGAGIGLRRRVEPHNVFVLTLGETGVLGLTTFVVMVGTAIYTFVVSLRRNKQAGELWQIVLAGTAGFTVFHVQTLVDVYWRRGVGSFGWACLGMTLALAVPSTARRRTAFRRQYGAPPAQAYGDTLAPRS